MSSDQVTALVKEASESIRNQQFEGALDLARQALEIDSRHADAYNIMGVAYSQLGRTEEATEAFQRAVQQAPYSARNYYNLARHYYQLGNKKDAISMCQEAIRCDGKHRNSAELLKKLESEVHVEVAPYTTSLGDNRGSAYQYKKEKSAEGQEPPL